MDAVERAAQWAGLELSARLRHRLQQFQDWLATEALPAGGLGPEEGDRLETRHVADSLLFAAPWRGRPAPETLIDLGSGVGLPGIPLALVWPSTAVTLVDRAGRRADLARRAVRILSADNVAVWEGDAGQVPGTADLVVARATAAPARVLGWGRRLLRPGGMLVVGGSHRARPAPVGEEAILAVPPEILDHPVWLRMMAAP